MIIFEGVTKFAGAGEKKRKLLTAVQAMLPSDRRIAIFAGNDQDKKLFIDLLAGVVLPSAGRIVRNAQVSFPPGYLGGFTRELSVRQNVAHVARMYGADIETVVNFVSQISGLGKDFNKLYGDLPNTKKRYLSDILAFSIPFDVYLLGDDVVRAGPGITRKHGPCSRRAPRLRACSSHRRIRPLRVNFATWASCCTAGS